MAEATPPLHLRVRGIEAATERLALRAVLTAAHLLGLAAGVQLRKLRAMKDPLADLQARLQEADPPRSPRMGGRRDPRRSFRQDPRETQTLLHCRPALPHPRDPEPPRLERTRDGGCLPRLSQHDPQLGEGLRPGEPDRGFARQAEPPGPPRRRRVRSLVQTMARLGFGGQDLLARILARAGWRVSARSVGRYRREPLISSEPTPDPRTPRGQTHPVIARFVRHTWMMEVSQVRQLLGPDLFMATVFDAFSRVPLALKVFGQKPGAADMARLLRTAAQAFGPAKYVITDLGGEFTGGIFRKTVARLGIVHRFASADNLYATARLERFWRTLKKCAGLRHQGLGGAVPAEALLGLERAHQKAVEPPRGRRGDRAATVPFAVVHLDESKRFPLLEAAA